MGGILKRIPPITVQRSKNQINDYIIKKRKAHFNRHIHLIRSSKSIQSDRFIAYTYYIRHKMSNNDPLSQTDSSG